VSSDRYHYLIMEEYSTICRLHLSVTHMKMAEDKWLKAHKEINRLWFRFLEQMKVTESSEWAISIYQSCQSPECCTEMEFGQYLLRETSFKRLINDMETICFLLGEETSSSMNPCGWLLHWHFRTLYHGRSFVCIHWSHLMEDVLTSKSGFVYHESNWSSLLLWVCVAYLSWDSM